MEVSDMGAPRDGALIVRIVTYEGEVYRLAGGERALRAVAGRAWITYGGRDIILTAGEQTALAAGDDFALVSALGRAPLVLEVLADPSDGPTPTGLRAIAPAALAI